MNLFGIATITGWYHMYLHILSLQYILLDLASSVEPYILGMLVESQFVMYSSLFIYSENVCLYNHWLQNQSRVAFYFVIARFKVRFMAFHCC